MYFFAFCVLMDQSMCKYEGLWFEVNDLGPISNVVTMNASHSFTNTQSITLHSEVMSHVKTFIIGNACVRNLVPKIV